MVNELGLRAVDLKEINLALTCLLSPSNRVAGLSGDIIKSKEVTNGRGNYALRWQDERSGRWREKVTDLSGIESNRAKAFKLLAALIKELEGNAPPKINAPCRDREELFRPHQSGGQVDGAWDACLRYFTRTMA